MKTALALAGCLLLGVSAAHASTIVNLNASATSPNAGKNSGNYAYNPVTISLDAGTYSVSVVGKAGGGSYDGYTVYADTGSNAAWTDAFWSVSFDGGATTAFTQGSIGRSNTALAAVSAYSAQSPYVFTLTGKTTLSFAVDDGAMPYFADDTGGVSLGIASLPSAVPEPATLGLLGLAGIGAIVARRRRRRGA